MKLGQREMNKKELTTNRKMHKKIRNKHKFKVLTKMFSKILRVMKSLYSERWKKKIPLPVNPNHNPKTSMSK